MNIRQHGNESLDSYIRRFSAYVIQAANFTSENAMMALKNPNALLTIVVDGSEQMALAKDVQRDPIKPVIEHVDLVIVRKGEKVTVDVAVHLEGEAAPETVVTLDNSSLQVEALATNIPESIVVSVEGLEAGTQILAGAVELPEGATLVSDAELLVVNVVAATEAGIPAASIKTFPGSDTMYGAFGSGVSVVGAAIDLSSPYLESTEGYGIVWPVVAIPILLAIPVVARLAEAEQATDRAKAAAA